jgi:hypothetical protein
MKVVKRDRLAIFASKLIAKAQAKLHVSPEALVLLEWTKTDANGRDVERVIGKSHSLVRNYYSLACASALIIPTAPVDSKTDNNWGLYSRFNTFKSIPVGAKNISDGAISYTTYNTYSYNSAGLVVGTGTNAESFEDYTLQTQIGPGMLWQGSTILYASMNTKVIWDAGARTWTSHLSRGFTNGNKTTYVITEVGLYDNLEEIGNQNDFLMARDILSSPVTLAQNESVVFKYTFSYQFP